MSVYLYRARDAQGALITGQVEASAVEALKIKLASQGLIPLSVKGVAQGIHLPNWTKFFGPRIKLEEILVFTRQFQTLFKAGLGMEAILSALIRQCQNKGFQEVLQKIRAEVSSGGTLSSAFSKHPKVFRELYINMLAAGEEAGILEGTLKYLADLLEKESMLTASVKSAILYPKIVLAVLVMAISILMIFVVPKFATFYEHYQSALPLPTLILMKLSHLFVHGWYLLAAIAGLLIFAFKRYQRTARGKLRLGKIAFQVPVFGPLNLRVANARFCHILSSLYRSGLPITRALEITGGTLENGAFRRDVEILCAELTGGRSLSEGMGRCHYFTPVIMEATAAGEKSGALDEMLESVGGHYDMEVGHSLKNLTTMLEPILLIFIFGIVGLFAMAIFLPIWNMSQLVGGG